MDGIVVLMVNIISLADLVTRRVATVAVIMLRNILLCLNQWYCGSNRQYRPFCCCCNECNSQLFIVVCAQRPKTKELLVVLVLLVVLLLVQFLIFKN